MDALIAEYYSINGVRVIITWVIDYLWKSLTLILLILTTNRYNYTYGNGEVEDIVLFVNSCYHLNENSKLYAFGSYCGREDEEGGFIAEYKKVVI